MIYDTQSAQISQQDEHNIYIYIYIYFFLHTDTNLGKVNVNLIIAGRSKMDKTFYIKRLKNQVYLTHGLMN